MREQTAMLSEAELNSLYQYAFGLCQRREDAHDLLQSALEKYLIEMKRSARTIRNPAAFMRTLIRNRHIDQYRHQLRWSGESYEECATYDISPASLEQICIDAQSLRQVWEALSPADRDILTAAQLRYRDGGEGVSTLYEVGYDPAVFGQVPRLDLGESPKQLEVRGLTVSLWVERDLLMVLVEEH